MLKKTITYTDFNGTSRTEDFYFNLTKAELAKLELSEDGGFSKYIEKIVQAQDVPTLAALFEKIVLMSYGEKSADGKRFIKTAPDGHKLADDFVQTEAYSELYMELVTDDKAAAAFMNGVVPQASAPAANSTHPALKG